MKPNNNAHGGRNSVLDKTCWFLANLSKRKYNQVEIRNELKISQRSVGRYIDTLSTHFLVCSEQVPRNAKLIYYWIERGNGKKEIWED